MMRCVDAYPPVDREEMMEQLRERGLQLIIPGSVFFGILLILTAEAYHEPLSVSVLGAMLTVLPLVGWLLRATWRQIGSVPLELGYLGFALLAVHWIGAGGALPLLAVAPGLLALLIGRFTGLISAGAATILVLSGIAGDLLQVSARVSTAAAIWAVQALVWASTGHAMRAMAETWSAYARMRELLEAARDQRCELLQVQEDLVKTNIELKRVSERLEAMRKLADQARRAKEEFVANVSHELRTPLNLILGFSEMISQAPHIYGPSLPPRLLADIEIIRSNSQHLSSLIDDVLDLSQIDAGFMALSREWTHLAAIVEAAATAVRPLFDRKRLFLEIDFPADLPMLFCDPVRIRQVILNLLSNAGRFTERGGVQVRAGTTGTEIVISVRDTGPGIPPEAVERIFEPFMQADHTLRRRFGGNGLGLAISRRLVELHGGRMWVESTPRDGTTFFFSLPLDAAGPAPSVRGINPYHPYERRARPFKAPHPRLIPRYVLVERGDTLSRLLSRYLGEVEIVTTHDLAEALAEASRLPCQALVISDPGIHHSTTMLDQVANLAYGTPAIFCWIPDQKEMTEHLGLSGYLTKPVSQEALLRAIDSLGRPVRTILLIDDEPDALQLLGRMLGAARRGYRVLRATSIHHAEAILRQRRPDIVLLDLLMPGLDGLAFLQRRRDDPTLRAVPVIAVTARDAGRGPIASNFLAVTRGGGLTVREILDCIQALGEILAPPDQLVGRAHSPAAGA
jgi:signal transduction histidine kinase/CheY-like chemotaxis protein